MSKAVTIMMSVGALVVLYSMYGPPVVEHPKSQVTTQASTTGFKFKSDEVRDTSCTLTAAKYQSVAIGDSYSTVVSKMNGCGGEELSRTEMAGYTTVMMMWKNWGGSNMNAMFQNGKVISKAQFGL